MYRCPTCDIPAQYDDHLETCPIVDMVYDEFRSPENRINIASGEDAYANEVAPNL